MGISVSSRVYLFLSRRFNNAYLMPRKASMGNNNRTLKDIHFFHPRIQQGYHDMNFSTAHSIQTLRRGWSGPSPVRTRGFMIGPVGPDTNRLSPKYGTVCCTGLLSGYCSSPHIPLYWIKESTPAGVGACDPGRDKGVRAMVVGLRE